MATLKCKMCGGELELTADENICECTYCGTKQTVPTADNDKKITLFDRANRLRMKSEFDKAASVYESIVTEFPEEAEAYWGLCLCKYGIEYVDDPGTGKKVPTCHRTSFEGIFKDTNFELAQEYSDGITRSMYREEAKEIDRLQKAILEIAQKEEPFDIFICYKETDETGGRTKDSVRAQEIYNELTKEGYKVFFSRITLEDKLGEAYEPYIFSALNSSKIMLAIGTSYDNYNAVWVKNEWSRFLQMMKEDPSKKLIPCYSDIDAYDMPEEFSNLQGQDMAKIGFLQDLLRGIGKILRPAGSNPETTQTQSTSGNSGDTVAPLLKRAFMFLEDGDFKAADEYCERVLDLDPENAQAYLGKMMAEMRRKKQEDLRELAEPFDDNNFYKKAVRFGDEEFVSKLESCNGYIRERNENIRQEGIYNEAISILNNQFSTAFQLKRAGDLFSSISSYLDASEKAEECLNRIQELQDRTVYNDAEMRMNRAHTSSDYEEAAKMFQSIPSYQDADKRAETCLRKAKEIHEKEEAERIAAEKKAEEERIEAEQKADYVIDAFLQHYRQTNSEDVKQLETKVAELNQLKEERNDLVQRKGALEQESIIQNRKMEELQNKRQSLGIFARKEKADTDAQIEKAKGDQNARRKNLENIEERIKEIPDADQIEELIKNCNQQIEQLREELSWMDSEQPNSATMLSYEEAVRFYQQQTVRRAVCKKKPVITFLIAQKRGDGVTFGDYHGPIEWQVLTTDHRKALLISKYGLDAMPYNTKFEDTTWENCSLRQWLNNDFLKKAFNAEEQKLLITTKVPADKNPDYKTNPGNGTIDNVFLLSIPEAKKYFSSDEGRKCAPTDYAKANGAYVSTGSKTSEGKIAGWWWLRSPGSNANSAADVYYDGSVFTYGILVGSGDICVRPALWIDLDNYKSSNLLI